MIGSVKCLAAASNRSSFLPMRCASYGIHDFHANFLSPRFMKVSTSSPIKFLPKSRGCASTTWSALWILSWRITQWWTSGTKQLLWYPSRRQRLGLVAAWQSKPRKNFSLYWQFLLSRDTQDNSSIPIRTLWIERYSVLAAEFVLRLQGQHHLGVYRSAGFGPHSRPTESESAFN